MTTNRAQARREHLERKFGKELDSLRECERDQLARLTFGDRYEWWVKYGTRAMIRRQLIAALADEEVC